MIISRNIRIKLSNSEAKKAPLPESGDYIIRDLGNKTSGLALRVYAGGAKTWIVQKKFLGKPKKTVLGSFPDLSHTNAVLKAIATASTLNSGIDPALQLRAQKRQTERQLDDERLTIQVAFEKHIKDKRDKTDASPHTTKDNETAKSKLAAGPLWKMPLIEVRGSDLSSEYQRLKESAKRSKATNKGATQAGRIMRTLRAAFRASVLSKKLTVDDPFKELNELCKGWYVVGSRKIIVASAEDDLVNWWKAVESLRHATARQAKDSPTIADYMILSLLFGGRSFETLSLPWSSVNFRSGTVNFDRSVTKSKREHVIPFGTYARSILERRYEANKAAVEPSRYVFNASRRGHTIGNIPGVRTHIKEPKKACKRVGEEAGLEFAPHDLRRTFATLINETGVNSVTLDNTLNHAPTTTASKHYVVERLATMRRHYQALEDKILVEVGVKDLQDTTVQEDISISELLEFRKWKSKQRLKK